MTAALDRLDTPRAGFAAHARPVDRDRAAAAVTDLLDALGLDRESAGLADTPRRVAELYGELLTPAPFRPTTFPNDSWDQVVVRGDPSTREFCAFWLENRRVTAAIAVNVWDTTDDLKTLRVAHQPADPARLANIDIPLARAAPARR